MLTAYGLSDCGCVRTNNEDSFLVAPDLGLYVVADGMGGANAGEHASRMAVDTVGQIVQESGRRDSEILVLALQEANRRVIDAGKAESAKHGMGTTLVAAIGTEREMSVVSVGDSRAYLLDDDGMQLITEDQTWVHEVGRPMGLDEASLKAHPLRHVLTMAIGAGAPLVIHRYPVRLDPGFVLLLSSDGLHGVIEKDQMEWVLRSPAENARTLEQKCRLLIEAARRAGGPDNITAVLVRRDLE